MHRHVLMQATSCRSRLSAIHVCNHKKTIRYLQGNIMSAAAAASRTPCRAVLLAAQPSCLDAVPSQFNSNVAVYEFSDDISFPKELRNARALFLDQSGNVHSLYRQDQPLTGAYWDCLAILPALLPEGRIAVLGLGAGTIAHLLCAYYPGRVVEGWELDPAVIRVARQHMGMQQLEHQGTLVVHAGDALADSASVGPEGAVGIIVDLFAEGQLIPQLTQASTWAGIRRRLSKGGRVITNLGIANSSAGVGPSTGAGTTQQALMAMAVAFEGQLQWCNLAMGSTDNCVVITGPSVTTEDWQRLPADLQGFSKQQWHHWSSSGLQ